MNDSKRDNIMESFRAKTDEWADKVIQDECCETEIAAKRMEVSPEFLEYFAEPSHLFFSIQKDGKKYWPIFQLNLGQEYLQDLANVNKILKDDKMLSGLQMYHFWETFGIKALHLGLAPQLIKRAVNLGGSWWKTAN